MFRKLLTKINIMLLFIILLAAFMRLYRIGDYLTFLGDEGRDVLVVWNILHGHPTLLGPTASVGGFFLGPIYYYFMTPFLWLFNYNPVGPAVMVALFGIATVWLVYFVTSQFFNKQAGLLAAFFYAISPLVIAYSRSSWNPNPMPFFSLLCLYVLYLAVIKNKNWLYVISGVLLGIAMQLHYLATFLAVVVALYLLAQSIYEIVKEKRKINSSIWIAIKRYLLLFAGFIVGWSPFLFFEIRHGFNNIRSILDFVLHSKETGGNPHFWEIVNNVFFRVFARLIVDYPPPEQVNFDGHLNITIWYFASLALSLLATGFLFLKFIFSFKDKKDFAQKSLLFTWFVIGILLFGFYQKQIYDYYFTFLFPLPFIVTGALFVWLAKKHKVLLTFSAVSCLALAFLNLQAMPFRYPPNRQLMQVENISRFVYDKTEGKSFNFALITGGNSDHAYRYFFTVWGHSPVTIENTDVDPQRKSVTDQLMVVCETIDCHPLGDSLWEVSGFGRAEIAGEWNVSVVKVYRLVHYKENGK